MYVCIHIYAHTHTHTKMLYTYTHQMNRKFAYIHTYIRVQAHKRRHTICAQARGGDMHTMLTVTTTLLRTHAEV